MNILLDCVPCFARQALDAVVEAVPDPARREPVLRRLMREIADGDWSGSPPAMAQRLHRAIRRELGQPDPYRAIKDRMNETARQLVPAMRARIAAHPDPREAAVRVAIGGNLLDVGAKTQIAAEDLPAHLETIWTQPLCGDLEGLFQAAERAHSILYLADNAGEIFFDRLLIEQLPAEKITVFMRGSPVLNDATAVDAEAAGLPEIVPVLDNGSDAPGTILEDCSRDFRDWFDRADLIIAKGQGNYETLSDVDRNIFFLFTVKCQLVANRVGEPVGSLVVKPARNPLEDEE
jgi:damage-control phosphatase, subfamily I